MDFDIWSALGYLMGQGISQSFAWMMDTYIGGISMFTIFFWIILVKMGVRVLKRFIGMQSDELDSRVRRMYSQKVDGIVARRQGSSGSDTIVSVYDAGQKRIG